MMRCDGTLDLTLTLSSLVPGRCLCAWLGTGHMSALSYETPPAHAPEECSICAESLSVETATLGCGHKFCHPCIRRWAETKGESAHGLTHCSVLSTSVSPHTWRTACVQRLAPSVLPPSKVSSSRQAAKSLCPRSSTAFARRQTLRPLICRAWLTMI